MLGQRGEIVLIDTVHTNITSSNSILSFETEGSGDWDVWDRYLAIDGKRAFHIGNICGTCSFFFERMEGANQSINPKEIVNALNKGVKSLDKELLNSLEIIIPDGKYLIILERALPKLTIPGSENDYFSNEQVQLWGVDGFWGMPHFPKTEYYRLVTSKLKNGVGFYEFLIPTFPHGWLDEERVEKYRKIISEGAEPTMVTLSILDVKEPADWDGEQDITSHHCMAHYLIDGHHKAYAAALENKPLTMLAFLAIEQGVSSEDDVNELISSIKRPNNAINSDT